MLDAAPGFYLNLVPEGKAFSATSRKPWELRANGGRDQIDGIFGEKVNARILAHVDGGTGLHVFTVEEPERTADGGVDWTALKERCAPLYRELLESLGATPIVQSPGEAYTSLGRGLVDAHVYSIVGYRSFGWEKFTRFRIDPEFLHTDVLITMNEDKWDGLSREARRILDEVAREHERASFAANVDATREEGEAMIADGMGVFKLHGEGRRKYVEAAERSSWDRPGERDPTNLGALRAKFGDWRGRRVAIDGSLRSR